MIEHQLNLDPPREQVTGVVVLQKRAACLKRRGVACCNGVLSHSGKKSVGDFSGLRLREVFEMLYKESRQKSAQIGSNSSHFNSVSHNTQDEKVTNIPLPPRSYGGRQVEDVLLERTSVRRYTSHAISLVALSTMLACAQQGDENDWPLESNAGRPLTFFCLAWRIEGLASGIYIFEHKSHSLSRRKTALSGAETAQLFLEPQLATAPLMIWITGNLAAACAAHGGFGHRQLLLRAGAAGERFWMAALAMRLAGAVISGIIPGAGRQFLGLDGYTSASLLGFLWDMQHNSLVQHFGIWMRSMKLSTSVHRQAAAAVEDESFFHIVPNFYPQIGLLNEQFEKQLVDSVETNAGMTPFVYAFCPDRYQFLTASAERIFTQDGLEDLIKALRVWANDKLGTSRVSTPHARVYLNGCWRRLVRDDIEAFWHYILPLRPVSHGRLMLLTGNSNGSAGTNRLVRSRLILNELLVHRAREPYRVEHLSRSFNPLDRTVFLDGYFW